MKYFLMISAILFCIKTEAADTKVVVRDKYGRIESSYSYRKDIFGKEHYQFRDKYGSVSGRAETNSAGTKTKMYDKYGYPSGSIDGKYPGVHSVLKNGKK